MSYTGTVENGVIVLPEDVHIPDGASVEIVVKDQRPLMPFAAELLKLARDRDWPSDMAANHDHYLHGAPKK